MISKKFAKTETPCTFHDACRVAFSTFTGFNDYHPV